MVVVLVVAVDVDEDVDVAAVVVDLEGLGGGQFGGDGVEDACAGGRVECGCDSGRGPSGQMVRNELLVALSAVTFNDSAVAPWRDLAGAVGAGLLRVDGHRVGGGEW